MNEVWVGGMVDFVNRCVVEEGWMVSEVEWCVCRCIVEEGWMVNEVEGCVGICEVRKL